MTPARLEEIRRTVAAMEMAGGLASPKSQALGCAAELLEHTDELRTALRHALEAAADGFGHLWQQQKPGKCRSCDRLKAAAELVSMPHE